MGTTGQSESDLMREEDIEIDIPDEGETSEEYEEDEEDCEYDDDEEEEEEEEDNDRSYTVEELFKYKTHPDCQEEPENLIHSTLPILKKNAAKNHQKGNKRSNQRRNKGSRNRKNNNQPKSSPQVHLTEIKPLEKSSNRWKPSVLCGEDKSEVETILSKTNSILNKLTEENLTTLTEQLITMLIDDEEVLTGVINLIYDKALDFPKFSKIYAELCKVIQSSDTVYRNYGANNFITRLAKKASTVFKTISSANIGSLADYTEEERKYLIKLRYLGNIEFICQLYKLKLLMDKVPFICAQELLEQKNDFITEEDSLEALCKMIKSLGLFLHQKNPDRLNLVLSKLVERKEKGDLPLRIRFMILDLEDMRKHNYRVPPPASKRIQSNKGRLTRSVDGLPPRSSSQNSLTTSTSSLQTTDKKRRSISKAAGSPWRSQLAALPHSDKPQKVKPLFASTSALAFDNTNRDIQEEEEEDKQPTENDSKVNETITTEEKEEEEEEETLKTDDLPDETEDSIVKQDKDTTESETVESSEPAKESFVASPKLESSLNNLIAEYYDLHDEEEALECIKEITEPIDNAYIIEKIFRSVKKENPIPLAVKLVSYLKYKWELTSEEIQNAFRNCFSTIEDDAEEFPNIPKYLGLIAGELILKEDISFSTMLLVLDFIDGGVAVKFIGASLDKIFEKEENEEVILSKLNAAGITLSKIKAGMNITPERLPRYISNEKVRNALLTVPAEESN